MRLYHFGLQLEYDTYSDLDNALRFEFQCHVEFIERYIAKAMRSKKIETHEDYNGLYIALLPEELMKEPQVWYYNLFIYLPFDLQAYKKAVLNKDYSYYLDTIICGFNRYAELKNVSVSELIDIVHEFKKNGCQTKWVIKKKIFRELGLRVELHGELTTDYYQATVVVTDAKRNILCQGPILKTEACIFVYDGLVRDAIMENGVIYITDFLEKKRFRFNVMKLLDGIFSPEIEKIYERDLTAYYYYAGFNYIGETGKC